MDTTSYEQDARIERGAQPERQAAFERCAAIERNFASFYPELLPAYRDLVAALGGPGALKTGDPDVAAALVRGSRLIWLPKETAVLSWRRGEERAFAQVLAALHDANPQAAGVFARAYPALGHGLAELREALLSYAGSGAPAADPKARLLPWALAHPAAQRRAAALEGLAATGSRCPGVLPAMADALERHFRARDAGQLSSWLERGFSLVRAGRLEDASAFFSLEARESRSFLGLKGAVLAEEREVLRIFSASRCERAMTVLPLGVSSYGAVRSYTDGQSMFLPPQFAAFGDDGLNRRAYAAMTALMTGLVGGGCFSFTLASCAFRYELSDRYGSMLPDFRPNLAREYGRRIQAMRERSGNVLELVFKGGKSLVVLETELERFFYSFPQPWFVRALFSLFELARVENALRARYHGLDRDFQRMNAIVAAGIPAAEAKAEAGDGRLASFQNALRQLHLGRLGVADSQANGLGSAGRGESGNRLLSGLAALFERVRSPGAGVAESASCAFEAYNLFFDAYPLTAYTEESARLILWHSPLDPEIEPAIAAAASPELFPATRSDRAGLGQLEEEEAKVVDLTSRGEEDEKTEDPRTRLKDGRLRLYAYPEFDLRSQRYLRKRCVIHESILPPGDEAWFDGVVARNGQLHAKLLKRFMAMQPEEVELSRRWEDGQELHLGDAVDFSVELARGASADDRVYQRKILNVRDVALHLLVDASSSTRELVNGEPIIDTEKAALALLGSSLDALGDAFSIAAYNSNGPDKVYFNLVKDFDEEWNKESRSRIASITPWSANRDGCAIRHATARLDRKSVV